MARRGASPALALGLFLICALLPLTVTRDAGAAGEPAYSCKKVHTGTAQENPNPKGRPPLFIGDSTVNLPIPNLTAVGFSVNARGCRGLLEAINLARKLRQKGKLPHLVLMNDYGNGGVGDKLIGFALEALGRSRVLGFVTEWDADTGKGPAAGSDFLKHVVKRYPHRIFVLNWVRYSRPHHFAEPRPGAWFLPDRFHPNFDGAEAYAQFVSQALPLAREGRFPPLR
jgi:hypothetical protein